MKFFRLIEKPVGNMSFLDIPTKAGYHARNSESARRKAAKTVNGRVEGMDIIGQDGRVYIIIGG